MEYDEMKCQHKNEFIITRNEEGEIIYAECRDCCLDVS